MNTVENYHEPVFVSTELDLNDDLVFDTREYTQVWCATGFSSYYAADRFIRQAGWRTMRVADRMESWVFGQCAASIKRGVTALLHQVDELGFNCLSVDTVTKHRVLGVPVLKLCGHACQIQASGTLTAHPPRRRRATPAG
jgi:hypothetical protein